MHSCCPAQITFSNTAPIPHCCEYWLMPTAAPLLWRTAFGPLSTSQRGVDMGYKGLAPLPNLSTLQHLTGSSWSRALAETSSLHFSSFHILLPSFSFLGERSLKKALALASPNLSSGSASREPDTRQLWSVWKMDWSRWRVTTGKQVRRLLQQSS